MEHHLWLAENSCANVPHDAEYAVTVAGLAARSYFLRPSETIMRDVYERTLPFAGLFGWSGAGMSDLADLGLAMNAAALGLDADADRHFTEGIAICERAGTRSYLARFHFFWTLCSRTVARSTGPASKANSRSHSAPNSA